MFCDGGWFFDIVLLSIINVIVDVFYVLGCGRFFVFDRMKSVGRFVFGGRGRDVR